MAHVLLIEPDGPLAATYMRAFKHSGHSVAHAQTGQEAIGLADDRTPDVVVLELQLASQSGVGFLHAFRSYSEWQAIPVVLHTLVSPVTMALLQEAFARDFAIHSYLYKPQTNLEQLLRAVRLQASKQ